MCACVLEKRRGGVRWAEINEVLKHKPTVLTVCVRVNVSVSRCVSEKQMWDQLL